MHAHNVFFTLKDKSSTAVEQFVADSKKYLAGSPGIVSFACGVLEGELARDVNDTDFDVSLHVLFESKAAHDAYQITPSHDEFVARNGENWEAGRVFDTAVRWKLNPRMSAIPQVWEGNEGNLITWDDYVLPWESGQVLLRQQVD